MLVAAKGRGNETDRVDAQQRRAKVALTSLLLVFGAGCAAENVAPAQAPPRASPTAAAKGGATASLLTGEQISSVIAAASPGVKRQCWQPLLEARSQDAPTTQRVAVRVVVEPSGAVSDARTEPAPAYPGLSSCIANLMSALKFPASPAQTVVNVPFVFGVR